MKNSLLILFFFTLSFVSAQSEVVVDLKTKTQAIENISISSPETQKAVCISVKGIKRIEDIDIENFNKKTFLELMASTKRKNTIC